MSMKFTPSSTARRRTRIGFRSIGRLAPDPSTGQPHRPESHAMDGEVAADGDGTRGGREWPAGGVTGHCDSRLSEAWDATAGPGSTP